MLSNMAIERDSVPAAATESLMVVVGNKKWDTNS